jgi:hypothetical protein
MGELSGTYRLCLIGLSGEFRVQESFGGPNVGKLHSYPKHNPHAHHVPPPRRPGARQTSSASTNCDSIFRNLDHPPYAATALRSRSKK